MSALISPAEGIALVAVALSGAGHIVSWVKGVMGGTAKAVSDGERKAALSATEAAAVHNLATELARLTGVLERQGVAYAEHELDCAKRWAAKDVRDAEMVKALAALTRGLENTQKQLQNWVMGLAPSPAEALPANSPVRRRGGGQ